MQSYIHQNYPMPRLPLISRREIEVETEIRLIGPQRSGNNGVIAWLMKAMQGDILKAANCSFSLPDKLFIPYDRGTGTVMALDGGKTLLTANSWHLHDSKGDLIYRGSAKRKKISGEVKDPEWVKNNEDPEWDKRLSGIIREGTNEVQRHMGELYSESLKILHQAEIPSSLKAVIFHLEDFDPRYLQEVPWEHSPLQLQSNNVIYLVVLRDFPNWVASRIKSQRNVDESAVSNWVSVAQMHNLSKNHDGHDLVFIKYDQWLVDTEYRQGIASRIGITDPGLSDKVSVAGGGSSFDGLSMSGNIETELLKSRSKHLQGEELELFESVMEEHRDVMDLSRMLFL